MPPAEWGHSDICGCAVCCTLPRLFELIKQHSFENYFLNSVSFQLRQLETELRDTLERGARGRRLPPKIPGVDLPPLSSLTKGDDPPPPPPADPGPLAKASQSGPLLPGVSGRTLGASDTLNCYPKSAPTNPGQAPYKPLVKQEEAKSSREPSPKGVVDAKGNSESEEKDKRAERKRKRSKSRHKKKEKKARKEKEAESEEGRSTSPKTKESRPDKSGSEEKQGRKESPREERERKEEARGSREGPRERHHKGRKESPRKEARRRSKSQSHRRSRERAASRHGHRPPPGPPPHHQGKGWKGRVPYSDHPRWSVSKNKGVVKRAKQELYNRGKGRW